ncbi:hypothetical protein HMPREF1406_01418, partial [Helicobacter pylori GAM239Bi]
LELTPSFPLTNIKTLKRIFSSNSKKKKGSKQREFKQGEFKKKGFKNKEFSPKKEFKKQTPQKEG